MSKSLEDYNDYLCHLLIFGYSRTNIKREMIQDISYAITNFIDYPSIGFGTNCYAFTKIESLLLQHTFSSHSFTEIMQNNSHHWKIIKSQYIQNWDKRICPHFELLQDDTLKNSLTNCVYFSCRIYIILAFI